MDEFAQTRAPDDLFDDDFTPVLEPPAQPKSTDIDTFENQSKEIPKGPRKASRPQTQKTPSSSSLPAPLDNANEENDNQTSEPPASPTAVNTTAPRPPKHHQAVRGDRLATGGTPRAKLTEDELSERMAAAKLNNAKRAEAHRLAEADEANFQQREAKASRRRQDEFRARRVMDMERERNRLRKLEAGAKGGREWDEGKEDRGADRERGGYRRGVNGGLSGGPRGGRAGRGNLYTDGIPEIGEGRRGGYESRGRGRGRGERGRGRGGRGGAVQSDAPHNMVQQQPPDPTIDFPALPTPSKSRKQSLPPDRVGESLESVDSKVESWADQVEAKSS